MTPKVIGIRETRVVGKNNVITTAIVITYTVGDYGPFTLTTTQADIDSGAALLAMQKAAASYAALPAAPAG